MSYESEQKQYAEELETIKKRHDALKLYFDNNPNKKDHFTPSRERLNDYTRLQYERVLENKYNYFEHYKYSTLYLEYLILSLRKSELERNLNQSKLGRNMSKTADFIGSITPQHVSGKIYKVENGDGCAKFCLWFVVIDAAIIFLYWLISGGK